MTLTRNGRGMMTMTNEAPHALMRCRTFGNESLLGNSFTAFYCSTRCPGNLIIKVYDLAQQWRLQEQPVISGFHTPVEKEVLKIMLRSKAPVCMVYPRSLPKRIPSEFHHPVDEGRLLLLSPFDDKVKRATQHTAAQRNRLVVELAEKIFVAYAAPGSKTESFCRELVSSGMPCMTFNDPRTENLVAIGLSPI